MTPKPLIDETLAIRRIRLLLARVDQDCAALHPEIGRLAQLVESYDRERDAVSLGEIFDRLECASSDCTTVAHCELVRRDVLAEIRELLGATSP